MLKGVVKGTLTRLKNNLPFLLSGLMLTVLFVQPSKLFILLGVALFGLVFVISACKNNTAYLGKEKSKKAMLFLVISIAVVIAGAYFFYMSWGASGIVVSIAERLNISPNLFVLLIAVVIVVFSFYTVYNLLVIAFNEFFAAFDGIITFDESKVAENIKGNFFVFISAVVLLFLYITNLYLPISKLVTFVAIAGVLMFLMSSQIESIPAKVKKVKLVYKIISAITSVGVCAYISTFVSRVMLTSDFFMNQFLDLNMDMGKLFTIIAFICALFAGYSVFCATALLYDYIGTKLKNMFSEINKVEYIFYIIIFALLFGYVTYSFINSQAFYRTNYACDIIYTSDSQMLVKDNAYMSLTHYENDIRQPLFAVFSAPFVGFGYALSLLFPFISCSTELFMNFVQIIMMLVSNLILAKLLKLSSCERVGFMILSSFTYTTLLFSVMMEQYIVAYFWVVLFVYLYCEEKKVDNLVVVAAGGSLLTSLILTPFSSQHFNIKNLNNRDKIISFVRDMERVAVVFVITFCAFARYCITNNFSTLASFTGKSITISQRVLQYFSFISDCFIKPDTHINYDSEFYSWLLNDVTTLSIFGVIIFVLAVLGFVLTRKNTLSKISIFWVAFSVLILLVVGWGASENGMILYSLYFGWAFLVLIYQLVLVIAKKLNIKALTIIFSISATVALAIINIPAISELLKFAITYYPA